MTTPPPVLPQPGLLGPVIVTGDTDRQTSLFTRAFGLEVHSVTRRTARDSERIWSVGLPALETTLMTPGTRSGIRLLEFTPSSTAVARGPENGDAKDAFKVIDFYCPDPERVEHRALELGARKLRPTSRYDLDGWSFSETHLWIDDGVVCALCSGDPVQFRQYVTMTDRDVSEVMSVSAPVRDPADARWFYLDVLGLNKVYEYAFADESFQSMVGLAEGHGIRAANYGSRLAEPYIGIIDYGRGARDVSLRGVRPPTRGLVACTIAVPSARDAVRAARDASLPALEPAEEEIPPFGRVTSALIESPNGMLHHVVSPPGP
ncbi:hypothetical protein [Microbispora sp. H13382]|uniref:hypothetical protein n=1 Tax=Microbispora sp. H13382 TaxID=2729112 RepID=UPI0016032CBF|nr:hypothetical protein [Microbispora sp. H13382]